MHILCTNYAHTMLKIQMSVWWRGGGLGCWALEALIAHLEKSDLLDGAKVLNPAICMPMEAGFEKPQRA